MPDQPMFSIIIPVHNKLPHLDRSINSVLNQTFTDFELLIIDDASTDGSSEKVLSFKHDKVKSFKRDTPGPGGYAARNLGIQNAKADWILFLDADDEWEPNLLEIINSHINDSVDLICWSWYYMDKNRQEIDSYAKINSTNRFKYFTLTDYLEGPRPMWTGAIALKKHLLVECGGFPEGKYQRGGDIDTWIRYLIISKKNLWIKEALSYYYLDSVNMVTKNADATIPATYYTLNELLKEAKDNKLKNAIKKFQNSTLYSVLLRHISKGKGIDLALINKMNFASIRGMIYLTLLVKTNLEYKFKSIFN